MMSKRRKIFVGLLTAWPIVYIGLFMLAIMSMFVLGPLTAGAGNGGPPTALFGGFGLIFVGHAVTMLLQFGLLFFFLFHVFKRKDLETNTQLLWALLIFMGGPFGQLIYWWKEIWKDEPPQTSTAGMSTGPAPDAGVQGATRPRGHDGRV